MDYFGCTCKDRKPIHLFKSILMNDYHSIDYLLTFLDKDMYNYLYNEDDLTPLMLASKLNHYELVELLLKKDVDVDVTNDEGKTALHIACAEGNDDIVFLLLQNDADVNLLDNDSKSPMDYAIKGDYIDVVSELCNYDVKLNNDELNNITNNEIKEYLRSIFNDDNEPSQPQTEPSSDSPAPSLLPE
jgi:ankyrin repeat protein